MQDSPEMDQSTPVPNTQSNVGIQHLDKWLATRYKGHRIQGQAECVPALNLLKPSSSFGRVPKSFQRDGSSSGLILVESRSKFLQFVGYHLDGLSIGGQLNFLTTQDINQALIAAQLKSVQHCKNMCAKEQCVHTVSKLLMDELFRFFEDAKIKIKKINEKNRIHYLEHNKANELQKFADSVADHYPILFQAPDPDETCVINFYNSRRMNDDLEELISQTLETWGLYKKKAFPDNEENTNYTDDVGSSLDTYKKQLLSENHERLEKYLNDSLERGYNTCKKSVEGVVLNTAFLDEITSNDLKKHLKDYYNEFTQELNTIVQLQLADNEQEPTQTKFRSAHKEKEEELWRFGTELYNMKYKKAQKNLHAEAKDVFRKRIKMLQDKYRLNEAGKNLERYVLKALDRAQAESESKGTSALNVNDSDEENTAVVTSSVGTSTASTSSILNSVSGVNQNGQLTEGCKSDPSLKYDYDSDETVVDYAQVKRFKEDKSSKEQKKKKTKKLTAATEQ